MMKQLKQPSQIIKIISDKNNHNISDIIVVQEYSLVRLKEDYLNQIYQAKEKIVDAIPIHYQCNEFQVAILYQSGFFELFQPKTHQITLSFNTKDQLKMPYKLYYDKNFLYISDYIQGMIIINLSIQEERIFTKKNVKIISVVEIEDHTLIFYYETKKLIQYDLKTQKEICLLENQQIQRFSNISKLLVKNNVLIIYSYQTLIFFQLNPFQEINNYSKLINNRIIDVLEYGENKNQFLIIQENGQIDLITLKTDKTVSNHLQIIKLDIEDIQLSYLLNYEQLIVVSIDGIFVFDSNFILNFKLQLCIGMTNLFTFQNNLYAIKQQNNYSKPFVLKNIKNIQQRQNITNLTQTLLIKQIVQINQYLLIITNNQIQLYHDNQQLQVLAYQSQIHQFMILDNQYILLSNDQKLILYQLSNNQIQLKDQIYQGIILMQKHYELNQFTIFNNDGYIQIYKVDQNKLILQFQSQQQYLDLSTYHIDQQNLTICKFDCQLNQFQFQQQTIENPIKTYQLNSIALLINYNNVTKQYQVFCQDGQYYIFNNELNLISINNPVGINNIVSEIQYHNNIYLITILQSNLIKYLVIEDMNEYYILVKDNEQLFLSNQNELFLLNTQNLSKITLKDQEIGYIDVNMFPNKEILLLKDNILITQNSVYIYYENSFEKIHDFVKEQKIILNADIEMKNLVLLLNDQSICIMKVYQNELMDMQIYQTKEQFNYQQVKLSKDIVILTYQNQVNIYSLNKFQLLEQFKAIYPDKNVCKDEQIIQIYIEQHTESQLILNLLIQYAGIAIINLKLIKNNGITQLKLNKKIYSPIDVSEHLRMQILQSTWQLFNTKNQCHIFKHVHNFFDSSLQPIQDKPEIMNDYVIDSIQFNGVIYYLGICGALWSINLD